MSENGVNTNTNTNSESESDPDADSGGVPDQSEITSQAVALQALNGYNGATILSAEYAQAIADQFDVTLSKRSDLQPISRMDRLQPDNDDLGIGVGSLCETLCEAIDGIDAAHPTAGGHGRTQRMLKDSNLNTLETIVDQ